MKSAKANRPLSVTHFRSVWVVAWSALIILIATASNLGLAGIPERPKPPRLCNDFSGTLTAEEQAELEAFCVALDKETSVQLCLVVIPDMDGMEVSDYANRLFEQWGIGRAQQDDGVLLLMALSERRIRIENGYGLESVLTDALSRRLIEQDIRPAMRFNGLAAALNAGAQSIATIIRREYTDGETRSETANGKESGGISLFWVVFGLVMIIWILGSLGGGIGGGGGRSVGRGGTRSIGGPLFFPSGGFGGGGFGGGGFGGGGFGGFGGFGGGLSGGGGASGSW